MPDNQLVQLMAAGDRAARAELCDRHRLSVYAQVYVALVDPTPAQHAVVETFDRAWRTASEFNPRAGSALARVSGIARARAERRGTATPPRRRVVTRPEQPVPRLPCARP